MWLFSALQYIGQKGRDIYNTWALKSAEIDEIDALFDMFEANCNPKQNVTVLRYKFNTRDQRSDENIDQYVTELRRLANDCSYGELLEEMIRDRIVCGTNNPRIKEKRLQAETLDLSRAINIARGIKVGVNQVKTKYKTIKDSEVGKNGNLEDCVAAVVVNM